MTITLDVYNLNLNEEENQFTAHIEDDWRDCMKRVADYFKRRDNRFYIDEEELYKWLNLHHNNYQRRVYHDKYATELEFEFGIKSPITVKSWFPTRKSRVIKRVTVE
jgi:hypothetical protein